ncbi:hypothetical protein DFH08DRAFT_95996, partial [Mycena albidolilacea]
TSLKFLSTWVAWLASKQRFLLDLPWLTHSCAYVWLRATSSALVWIILGAVAGRSDLISRSRHPLRFTPPHHRDVFKPAPRNHDIARLPIRCPRGALRGHRYGCRSVLPHPCIPKPPTHRRGGWLRRKTLCRCSAGLGSQAEAFRRIPASAKGNARIGLGCNDADLCHTRSPRRIGSLLYGASCHNDTDALTRAFCASGTSGRRRAATAALGDRTVGSECSADESRV